LSSGLVRLREIGVRVGTLAVLGGEPTMFAPLLERAVLALRAVGIAERIEVVSNGLTPQRVTLAALAAIDRFTISVYVDGPELLDLWREWLVRAAPHVELQLRRSEGGWDRWTGDLRVSGERAQQMFEGCWYRKHCVTLERGRLFLCSRIAKLAHDDEGLVVGASTTLADVRGYLGRREAIPSCATCVPMMGLPTVRPGAQPDDRVARLDRRAVAWLRSTLAGGR
jgi:hypothetical protein